MAERYTIGTFPIPDWARCCLAAYRKADGSVSYEYSNRHTIHSLDIGDVLVKDGTNIRIERRTRKCQETHMSI